MKVLVQIYKYMCVYIDAYTHTCVLTEIHMYGLIAHTSIYIHIYDVYTYIHQCHIYILGGENRTNLPFCQKYLNFNGIMKHCKYFVLFIFVVLFHLVYLAKSRDVSNSYFKILWLLFWDCGLFPILLLVY